MQTRFRALAFLVVLASVTAAAQTPTVTLSDPSIEGLIGDTVTFSVTFDNTGAATGYGPFIELVLDAGGADQTSNGGPCDGITIVSASVSNTTPSLPITPIQTLPAGPCAGGSSTTVAHPFAGLGPVTVPAGGQHVILPLQFGSFDPTQATVTIQVTVRIHRFADDGHPLKAWVRGGFRYGADALDNAATDKPIVSAAGAAATSWPQVETITPRPWRVKKQLVAPEGETVSGPNFEYSFTISVDVAPEQTITGIALSDCASTTGLIFKSMKSAKPSSAVISTFPPSPPNCFDAKIATVTGPPAATNPVIELKPSFWLKDTPPVVNAACVIELSNTVKVDGKWIPLDPRDPTPAGPHEVPVTKDDTAKWPRKAIAIQKKATPASTPGPLPGGFIDYTLDFQISDYLRFGNIIIRDWLSDGQTLVDQIRFRVRDRYGAMGPGYTLVTFPPAAFGFAQPVNAQFKCDGAPPTLKGATQLTFNISKAMTALYSSAYPKTYQYGVLTGGEATGPGGGPAIGQITFRVRVNNKFNYGPHSPTDDTFLDKHDPLMNSASITGRVVRNAPVAPPLYGQQNCDDDTFSCLTIPGDQLEKTVIAQNGKFLSPPPKPVPPPPLPTFARYDTITFSLKKVIPSGDGEAITIDDWFPLPAIHVTAPAAATALPACASATTLPAVNTACYLSPIPLPAPTYAATPSTNSVRFNIGTLQNTANTPQPIEIRITLPVSDDPMADGLHLTNEAQECERNSFGRTFCQIAVAQFVVSEPRLKIWKSVVCTAPGCPPQPPAGAAICNAPAGTCPRFSTAVTSANLATLFANKSVNLDANDTFTYAIAVENLGSYAAFDVLFHDDFGTASPATMVPNSMCVRRGDGAAVATSGSVFGPGGFALQFPSLAAYSPASGQNIIVVTFDMKMKAAQQVKIGECATNTATLDAFANHPAGANFVTAGLAADTTATATAEVRPKALAKTIDATSEGHTPSTTPRPVAIGEIVRYRLTIDVPEGMTLLFRVVDTLPPGFIYLGPTTVTPASGGSLTWTGNPSAPTLSPAKDVVTFQFGAMTNLKNDPGCETITIVFNALVLNDKTLNPDGAQKPNSFEVFAGGFAPNQALCGRKCDANGICPIGRSPVVTSVIARPFIKAQKTSTPAVVSAGDSIQYAIAYTNTGSTTAFDVVLSDPPPPTLTFVGPATVTMSPPGCATGVTSTIGPMNVRLVSAASMAPGCTITASLTAVVAIPNCPPAPHHNVASIRYTSLTGPKGTLANPTGSQTPGASGAIDGELLETVTVVADTPCKPIEPKLVVKKRGATAQGRFIHYWIEIENVGSVAAFSISVKDTPGPGYVKCAHSPGGEQFTAIPPLTTGAVGPITQSTGKVTNYTAAIESLAPGSSVTLQYDGVDWNIQECGSVPCPTLINTVVVTWSWKENDPNPPYSATATDPLCTHF